MNCFNQLIITGNLTRDPELRHLPGGRSVCRLSVAVNEPFKDADGQRRERSTYVDVDFWDKAADTLARCTAKGKPLMITGRLRLDRWTDKTTNEQKSRLGVTGVQFLFLPDGKGPSRSATHEEPPESAPSANSSAAPDDGDVPF